MNVERNNSDTGSRRARGIVSGKAHDLGPGVEVGSDALTEVAIRGLIDDWLVPAIVDRLLRDLTRVERDE